MANKFLIVPEEIYRGLTAVSDTGDINLDAVRHELQRARSERANPSAKNVRYNQQLRRYLHMRKEYESKPTKVALSKGLSLLVKRGGEEEAEVVDIPHPPAQRQHSIPQTQRSGVNTPQPPAQGPSRIAQIPQSRRPVSPPPRQSIKRKTTKFRAPDPTEVKRNLITADTLEPPPLHKEAARRFQQRVSRKRAALKQPTRNEPERDLVAEAAAAPLPYDFDDDVYLLEDGSTLSVPSVNSDELILPDSDDDTWPMEGYNERRIATKRKAGTNEDDDQPARKKKKPAPSRKRKLEAYLSGPKMRSRQEAHEVELFSIPPQDLTMDQQIERIYTIYRPNFVFMDSSNEKEAGDGHQGSISVGNRTTLPSPKVELIKAALDPLYNDLSSPSAFAGVEGLQREARKKLNRNKINISKKDVQNYLEGHRTYTLLRPRRVRFPRAKTVAAGFMTDVQVDLADLQTLSRHNRGYRYLLVAVDVLSKRLFVVPLLTKRAEDMLQAFKQLIEQMPMAPHRIFSDKGTEFRNRLLKEFFEQQDIAKHEPVHSSVKASVAERAIRNVKQRLYRYFAQKETLNWVDVVQKIIDGINKSVSRVHGMRPVDVNFKNAQQVWLRIYGTDDDGGDKQQRRRRRPRFRKDEFVRMSREKGQFEKGYLPNYGDEILTIDAVLEGVRPVRYKLRDERGEKFKGTFYEHELARVRKDAETSYRIEKVYRKRKRADGSTEILVKFAGFFVFLPSNVTDYPDNQPNKFRVRLPKSIEFNGFWVCGLHSVSYPYSWHSTIGTLDDQWINIHFLDVFDPQDRDTLRVIRLPVPKASLKKVEQLRDFLATVLKHHSRLLQSLTQNKEVTEFVDRPEILASPPPLKRRKRSTGETLPLPPSVEVDETLPLPPSADKTTLSSPPREQNQHIQQKYPQQTKQHHPYNQNQFQHLNQHLQQQKLQKTNQNHTYNQKLLQHLYQHLQQQQQPAQTKQHNSYIKNALQHLKQHLHSHYLHDPRAPKPGEKERAQQMLSVLVGEDRVKSSAIEYLKAIVDSVDIQYEETFERFKLVVNRAGVSHLSFSPQLGFAVYSKGLTENVIIGNTLSSLLRVVSVTGAVQGEYNEKIYDSPIYARVLPREISEIEIELRTMDSGRLVPFAYGTTMVVLIFKKVINF
uniref:Integrase catalytic domain-containing protein n=1 Tax=Globodera rostochiensis TaxID=31243 RepID=A0A914HYK8_GLORO